MDKEPHEETETPSAFKIYHMTDQDFLMWLHERLSNTHGESEIMDYMHKLRSIILTTPPERVTPNAAPFNSLAALRAVLKR